jgi:Ca2+-binding RTX toxin-like protein
MGSWTQRPRTWLVGATLASAASLALAAVGSAANSYGFCGATDANENIILTNGPDVCDGLGGNDNINGRGSGDVLTGGAGSDSVYGGDGRDDIQEPDGGRDIASGGSGGDFINVFDFETNDTASGGSGFDTCVVDIGDLVSGCEVIITGF